MDSCTPAPQERAASPLPPAAEQPAPEQQPPGLPPDGPTAAVSVQNEQFAKNQKQQDAYCVVEDLGAVNSVLRGLRCYVVADGHGQFGEHAAAAVCAPSLGTLLRRPPPSCLGQRRVCHPGVLGAFG